MDVKYNITVKQKIDKKIFYIVMSGDIHFCTV